MKKLISQGAEAKIYQNKNCIIKDRIKKKYRIPEIDLTLRKNRTKSEARILRRARTAGLNVPEVIEVNLEKNIIKIEFINKTKISELNQVALFEKIGEQINKMHEANIAHGDLTTSNMILKDNKIYLIDFGLSSYSEKIEDKAVDLHVFKECLTSKHFKIADKAWKTFLKTYKQKDVLNQLQKVEKRGKYKY